MPWGPTIPHNGEPVPHLRGKKVRTMTDDGEVNEPNIVDGHGGSWTWRDNYTHVVAYRIWQEPAYCSREEERQRLKESRPRGPVVFTN